MTTIIRDHTGARLAVGDRVTFEDGGHYLHADVALLHADGLHVTVRVGRPGAATHERVLLASDTYRRTSYTRRLVA